MSILHDFWSILKFGKIRFLARPDPGRPASAGLCPGQGPRQKKGLVDWIFVRPAGPANDTFLAIWCWHYIALLIFYVCQMSNSRQFPKNDSRRQKIEWTMLQPLNDHLHLLWNFVKMRLRTLNMSYLAATSRSCFVCDWAYAVFVATLDSSTMCI